MDTTTLDPDTMIENLVVRYTSTPEGNTVWTLLYVSESDNSERILACSPTAYIRAHLAMAAFDQFLQAVKMTTPRVQDQTMSIPGMDRRKARRRASDQPARQSQYLQD